MKKILLINACVRPDSRTYCLAKELLSKLPGTIEEVNLEKENIQPLDWKLLQQRNTYVSANDFSAPLFGYAKQFAEADEIVIAAPYWDLSFPATVRIYLEAVTVTGITFKYTPEGIPTGLCRANRVSYITTAGGAIGNLNFGFDYIRTLARELYGIKEVVCYSAENLDIQGNDVDYIMKQALREIGDAVL